MTGWLYQMIADKRTSGYWSHEQYQATVCEGKYTTYDVRKLRSKSGKKIQPGDILVLFYAWSGDSKGGIYGWGKVAQYNEERSTIKFRPMRPSDYLKMHPILDDEIKEITKIIRLGYF